MRNGPWSWCTENADFIQVVLFLSLFSFCAILFVYFLSVEIELNALDSLLREVRYMNFNQFEEVSGCYCDSDLDEFESTKVNIENINVA